MAGRELIPYENPSPTMGIHRIVLVLYQQLGRGTVFAPQVRQNFNLRNFARRFNLGKPVAAKYFSCQRQTGTGGRRFTWVIYLHTPHVQGEGKLEPTSYVCVLTYVWSYRHHTVPIAQKLEIRCCISCACRLSYRAYLPEGMMSAF